MCFTVLVSLCLRSVTLTLLIGQEKIKLVQFYGMLSTIYDTLLEEEAKFQMYCIPGEMWHVTFPWVYPVFLTLSSSGYHFNRIFSSLDPLFI